MDPNLFRLDWDRLGEVLVVIVVLAFFIERALSVVFEHRLFLEKFDQKGLKEAIAFLVSLGVCMAWHFDAISMVLLTTEQTKILGELLTAAVVAGGSKASVKLFRDVLNFKSTAFREMKEGKPKPEIVGGTLAPGPPEKGPAPSPAPAGGTGGTQ